MTPIIRVMMVITAPAILVAAMFIPAIPVIPATIAPRITTTATQTDIITAIIIATTVTGSLTLVTTLSITAGDLTALETMIATGAINEAIPEVTATSELTQEAVTTVSTIASEAVDLAIIAPSSLPSGPMPAMANLAAAGVNPATGNKFADSYPPFSSHG